MFKRKQEFRPDKVGAGWLSKLYITRRQRQNILRWALYGLALVVLSLLQDVIFCRFRLFGASTNLVCTGIFLLCILLSTDHCAVFAVVSAVLYYFSGSAAGPYSILYITAIGIFLNIFRSSYLRKSFFSTWICASTGILLYELLVFLTGVFLELTHFSRLPAFLITAGLGVVGMPILYPVFRWIGNIGGESWKD